MVDYKAQGQFPGERAYGPIYVSDYFQAREPSPTLTTPTRLA